MEILNTVVMATTYMIARNIFVLECLNAETRIAFLFIEYVTWYQIVQMEMMRNCAATIYPVLVY